MGNETNDEKNDEKNAPRTEVPAATSRMNDRPPTAPADRPAAPAPRLRKLTFPPGEIVDERYRIVRFIAQGGMGEVYEAEDLQLHEHVALKTVRPDVAEQENAIARFKREIQLARKVTHPNVCRIFDFGLHRSAPVEGGGEAEEVAFLTMELLPGESLTARLRRGGRMTPVQALPLVEQMAAALGAAHKAGIVHRDFKSANVMLLAAEAGGRVVVTDFGLARREVGADSLTGTGGIVGTPHYMAPEQVEGTAITAATDVYALGVVLYEMVSGRLPFEAESALSIAVKRLREPPAPLRDRVPDLDPTWEAAILRCLERDPAARFASVEGVLRALRGEAAPPPVTTVVHERGVPIPLVAAGVLAVLVAAGLWFALARRAPVPSAPQAAAPGSAPVAVTDRTSLAVFDFDNATGDPALEWLRTALTDMLLTDLSQSTRIRAVGTDRVRQALKEMNRPEERALTGDVIREVAARTGVDTVILGSFVKAGETLRIQVKVQDAGSGEILFAEHVDGPGQSRLFPMVAELTGRLREKLQVQATPGARPDQALEQFARGAAWDVPVAAAQASYRVGESLVVTVEVPRAGYLNLVNVGDGDAEATLLFPNAHHPQNRVDAGARVAIPAPGDPFRLPAGLPAGMAQQRTLLVAIHTQQPLNGYEMGLARADVLSLLKGADTGAFFAAASSGGAFGAGRAVVTITR